MEGREETDQCFQKMTAMHEGFVAWTTTAFDDYRQRLKEVHEIADLLKEENARLKRRLAMKHGRTPTGRGRGRPKKLVNTDGDTRCTEASGWKRRRGRGRRRVAWIALVCPK